MKLLHVNPGRGAAWMRQGFAIFARQPLGFSGMFAAFLFALLVLAFVPFVGSLLSLVALPLASLGFMIGTRRALSGRMPAPQLFAEPLRQGRPRALAMLQLGLVYAAAAWLVVAIGSWLDGGAFQEAMGLATRGSDDPQAIGEKLAALQFSLLLHAALLSLISVPFWHAPALVHWGGQGVAQSLFSSTVAIWRNKGAFLVYGLAWFGVLMVFGLVVTIVFSLLGMPMMGAMALMPASLIFWTAFYASLWFTFADCFGEEPPAPPSTHPITTDTP
jgi:hypothetical protein